MNTKKIISSLILSVFSFFILMPTFFGVVRAQDFGDRTWFNPSFGQYITKIWESPESEIFGERYTYAQTQWIIYSILSWVFPENLERCVVAISLREDSWTNIGAIPECAPLLADGVFGGGMTYPESQPFASVIYQEMNNNPMSGVGYISKKASELGLVQEVYAQQQGYGFGALAPVQELWQAVRNMTYFLLVLVAIILAFMIMFRTKTSPQTVINVQSAIPKLVIALILITFSYAIAGLLVDLSYLLLALFAMMLKLPGMTIINNLTTSELFVEMLSGEALGALFKAVMLYALLILLVPAIGALVLTGPFAGAVFTLGAVIVLIFTAIFAIFFIIIYIRILWMLIKTFINVVLLTIVGPMYILIGTLPGSGGFIAWIRSLAAQLVVFPIVIIMIFLAHFFFWRLRTTSIIGDLIGQFDRYNPYNISTADNLSGTIGLPGFNMSTGFMGFLGAFAILALTPHVANIVKSLVERQPFGYGSAIGSPLGGAGAWGWGQTAPYRGAARSAGYAQTYSDMSAGGPGIVGGVGRRLGRYGPTSAASPRAQAFWKNMFDSLQKR